LKNRVNKTALNYAANPSIKNLLKNYNKRD